MTLQVLSQLLIFALGLGVLTLGAELLVRGASRIALLLGVPPLVVGLTVVAYGTGAPELVVSAQAATQGQADLSVGNVLGSNISNVLLILGVSAILSPMVVTLRVIWREVPLMIAISLLTWSLAADGQLERFEGLFLVLLLIAYSAFQLRGDRRPVELDIDRPEPTQGRGRQLISDSGLVLAGIAGLVLGARLLISSGTQLARSLGVSELVIGLALIAFGTSLPELATSVLATIRGERDLAVGNVVGSNIFNLLGALGVAAALSPGGITVAPAALRFDFPVVLATAFACLPVFLARHRITRWEGAMFCGYYVAYVAFLFLQAKQHDALPALSGLMLAFVLPLTLITLVANVVRHWRRERVARQA